MTCRRPPENLYVIVYWGNIGIMENEMETIRIILTLHQPSMRAYLHTISQLQHASGSLCAGAAVFGLGPRAF